MSPERWHHGRNLTNSIILFCYYVLPVASSLNYPPSFLSWKTCKKSCILPFSYTTPSELQFPSGKLRRRCSRPQYIGLNGLEVSSSPRSSLQSFPPPWSWYYSLIFPSHTSSVLIYKKKFLVRKAFSFISMDKERKANHMGSTWPYNNGWRREEKGCVNILPRWGLHVARWGQFLRW